MLRALQLEYAAREPLKSVGFKSAVWKGIPADRMDVAFVTKSFMLDHGIEGLRKVARGTDLLLIDPVDSKLDGNMVDIADRVVASSLSQARYLRERLGLGHKSYLVPHHVDMRLPGGTCRQDKFSLAYIGAPGNGLLVRSLARERVLDLIPAQNPRQTGWMARVSDYNCHYLLRRRRTYDGFKPFTKGYMAARHGAVVIASRSDAEAILHLGPDYPFLFDIGSEADIRAAIGKASDSFNSEPWSFALKKMENIKKLFSIENVISCFVRAIS